MRLFVLVALALANPAAASQDVTMEELRSELKALRSAQSAADAKNKVLRSELTTVTRRLQMLESLDAKSLKTSRSAQPNVRADTPSRAGLFRTKAQRAKQSRSTPTTNDAGGRDRRLDHDAPTSCYEYMSGDLANITNFDTFAMYCYNNPDDDQSGVISLEELAAGACASSNLYPHTRTTLTAHLHPSPYVETGQDTETSQCLYGKLKEGPVTDPPVGKLTLAEAAPYLDYELQITNYYACGSSTTCGDLPALGLSNSRK